MGPTEFAGPRRSRRAGLIFSTESKPTARPQASPQWRKFRNRFILVMMAIIAWFLWDVEKSERWLWSVFDSAGDASIQQISVQTDAVDPDGYVGVRVHAGVIAGGSAEDRFAVHFADHDRNLVFSADPRFSDSDRRATCAVAVAPSSDVSDVTAFIPYTAFDLKAGPQRVELLPELLDSADRPLVVSHPVPFDWDRGDFYVTRVRFERVGGIGLQPTLTVAVRSERRQAINLSLVVHLTEPTDLSQPRHFDATGGARMITVARLVPAAHLVAASDEVSISIPSAFATQGATAEVCCYGPAGVLLSHPISITFP
jgi:hypothetical protein